MTYAVCGIFQRTCLIAHYNELQKDIIVILFFYFSQKGKGLAYTSCHCDIQSKIWCHFVKDEWLQPNNSLNTEQTPESHLITSHFFSPFCFLYTWSPLKTKLYPCVSYCIEGHRIVWCLCLEDNLLVSSRTHSDKAMT